MESSYAWQTDGHTGNQTDKQMESLYAWQTDTQAITGSDRQTDGELVRLADRHTGDHLIR